MTYSATAQLAAARSWVGFHEGPGNVQPFTQWQFNWALRNLAWCGSFADYCAVEKGGFRYPSYAQCGYKGNAYVPASVSTAKHMGIWRSPGTRARPGWHAIFSWNRNGVADHIETVIQDSGGKFITIGGNTSDAVLYRTRDRMYLMGFVALDQAGQTAPGTSPVDTTPPPAPAPEEDNVRLSVATPHKGIPNGRTAFAVLVPELNCVVLKNGGRIAGDKPNGPTEFVWAVPGNGKCVSIDKRNDGKGVVVLKDDNGTFDGIYTHLP